MNFLFMKIKGIDLLRGILLFVWTKKTMKYKKKRYQRKNTRGYDFFNNELFLLLYNCFCNISINISHRVHR